HDPSSPAHASLTASVVIPYAGDWTLDVTQGTYNVQHFLGSPHLITVAAAATDPASCVVKIPGGRSITAGSSFEAIVETFDEFENPTSHPEDSFKSRVELGNSEENFGNRHVLPPDHTFSEIQTVAGAYKLFLYHTNTQREVAGSPFSFDVLPAAASADASTHNIDFDEFESSKYWSDGGKRHNGATNEIEEEEAGWKESVIHRDLKPDNMLLTRDWTLKLTDFGEARAQNMGGTMTSVGTPIYIAPEVMRADHYDVKADTWSYGLCLVAMIRAERTLEQFFYQGDIGDEIKRREEPQITLYSKEDDVIYRDRIGKEDEIEDSDEEESGTKRGEVVSKKEFEKVVEAKDKAMAAKDKAMAELRAKMGKVEVALEEKAAEAGRWGAALREAE
ncbi:hypothetical protein TeGR_g5448, partial [Tetraparma gracilis]